MANNAPQNLDLSACTTSIDNGSTTKKMSEWAKIANDAAGQIGQISQQSTDSNQKVSDVLDKVSKIDVANCFTKNNAFTSGNPPILDNTSQFIGPKAREDGTVYMTFGHVVDLNTFQGSPDPNCSTVLEQHNLLASLWARYRTWTNGTDIYRSVNAKSFHPENDAGVDLGMNDHAWNNIYSKTAVSVTSDASEKKVLANLGDDKDADNQKLLDAIYNLNIHTYKLNDSINEKGEDKARLHNGFIAQDVERVLTDAGLNPSDYGMWIQDRVFRNIEIDTGKKDDSGKPVTRSEYQPVLDENGKQAYRQSLRYEEVFCVLIQSMKQKIDRLEKQVASLQGKNGK